VDRSGLAHMDVRIDQSRQAQHRQKKRAAGSDSLVVEKQFRGPGIAGPLLPLERGSDCMSG